MDKDIKVTLKVWRQKGPKDKGQFETYQSECFFLGNVRHFE